MKNLTLNFNKFQVEKLKTYTFFNLNKLEAKREIK